MAVVDPYDTTKIKGLPVDTDKTDENMEHWMIDKEVVSPTRQ